MSNAAKGLFAIVAVLALVVTLGAGRTDKGETVVQDKAVRTAGVDMAIGYFTCSGVATGEVSTSLDWQGTSGVVTASSGLSLTINTVVEPIDAEGACLTITDGLAAVAETEACTVSRVRFVGVTRDFVMVCSGITDDTNDAVAQTTRWLAENVRVE